MKVGRVVSAWLGALCLGMALTAGCAVAGGKTGQAEAVQAASDGSECRAEERMQEINTIWRAALGWPKERRTNLDREQAADLERRLRELTTCLKPAVQAGKLADPQDLQRYTEATDARIRLLRNDLDRKEEANALREERAKLADAGLLGVEAMLEHRTQLLNAAMKSGDLTQTRERAEGLIALALEAGVPAGDIEEWIKTRRESALPGLGGPQGEAFTAYFRAAVIARRKLNKLDRMLQTSVCGKVALADGGEEITATIFDGYIKRRKFLKVGSGGTYCLPVRELISGAQVYVYLTASGYQPQVVTGRSVWNKRVELPEVQLTPLSKNFLGAIAGVVLTISRPAAGKSGKGHMGKEIEITGDLNIYRTTSDKNGFYFLEVLPGSYVVSVADSPFLDRTGRSSVKVAVTAGETEIEPFFFPGAIE